MLPQVDFSIYAVTLVAMRSHDRTVDFPGSLTVGADCAGMRFLFLFGHHSQVAIVRLWTLENGLYGYSQREEIKNTFKNANPFVKKAEV